MNITDVKVFRLKNNTTSLKANVSITFDECFVVTGLKVIESQKGTFVSMPSQKMPNGEYKDTCFPLSKEFREKITERVLKAYEKDNNGNDYSDCDPF